MAKVASMTIGVPGVEVWIEYNPSNLRIQSVQWEIPVSGVVVRARVWDTDVSTIDPVYDRTEGGPSSGAQTIPGNNRLVEVSGLPGEGSYLDLPSNIIYKFNIETIG